MKLRAVMLENFRQFYGSQTLTLSDDDACNVTVVYGANGAGKTTLLAAFTWALYNRFPPAFQQPEQLVNERALAEAAEGHEVRAKVILEFEHERSRYTVERTTSVRKVSGGSSQVVLNSQLLVQETDETGRTTERRNASDAIDRILPERLHRFFFFDGERIEHLVKPDAYEEIGEAIKNLLGLEVVERAIRHLEGATRSLERERKSLGSPRQQEMEEELAALREDREAKDEGRRQAERNKAALEAERDTIDNQLKLVDEARQLQEQRDRLDREYEGNRQRLARIQDRSDIAINSHGYLAFAEEPAMRAIQLLEECRQKNELPTPIKRQFVLDLLEKGQCICGTPLQPGDDHYRQVEAWSEKAGVAEIEEALVVRGGQAKEFSRAREDLYARLNAESREALEIRGEQRRIREELSELEKQFISHELEDVQQLAKRRAEVQQAVEEMLRQLGAQGRDIQGLEHRINELNKSLNAERDESDRREQAVRRVQVAEEVHGIFREILELQTQDVRSQLDRRVKRIYREISFKDYEPELTDDFRLHLMKPFGGRDEPVAASTGENQILSLAFVGAIAELARERWDRSQADGQGTVQGLTFPGGIYPVVMDSPFGALDSNYRRQTAKAVPELAPQVVVFVSKSQGEGPVQIELRPRVGRQYVIEFHSTKQDLIEESLQLGGRDWPYIVRASGPHEWASLREV